MADEACARAESAACRRVGRSLLVALSFALAACNPAAAVDEKMTANISGYNHTADYIHQFYIDGQGGGNAFAYSGGGSFVCCIRYPKNWRPGLTAKVRWTTSSSDPGATGDAASEHWHEKVVPVERFTTPGTTLNAHFLPGGEVRLIITSMTAGWPGYPGPPAPVKPDDFPFQRG